MDPTLRIETHFAVFIADGRDLLSTSAMALVNCFVSSHLLLHPVDIATDSQRMVDCVLLMHDTF